MKNTERLSVMLPSEHVEKLKQVAADRGVPVDVILREATQKLVGSTGLINSQK